MKHNGGKSVVWALTVSLSVVWGANTWAVKGADAGGIARQVSKDFGVVAQTSLGTKGAPIMILEETHTSRQAQIEEAIVMSRLHEQHGMKHIALEGYLKERPEIKTEWFAKASKGLDQTARLGVAVRLLKEGDISGAEFMKLAYDDVVLHPIETVAEHSVKLEGRAATAAISYLIKIAQPSLRQDQAPKLQRLQSEISRLEGEAKQKKVKEWIEFILSANSWTQEKGRILLDPDAALGLSAERLLAMMEEIDARAKNSSAELEAEEKQAMQENLKFWRGRVLANTTMVKEVGKVADQKDATTVAIVVGAAHTEGMAKMLRTAGRAFAVVTPLSIKNRDKRGDLSMDMFDRKGEGHSIYSEGFSEMLMKALPAEAHKKPEPVLSQAWFQGKAELYLFTERIAGGILGPPNPPGGGKPPYGFSDDDFRGNRIFIDPKRITIVPAADNKDRAVLFPVVINPNLAAKRTEIWVKAGFGVGAVSRRERENVESMLRKALEEVKSEKEPPKRIEDKQGRVQISKDTMAAIAETQQDALKVALPII